MTILLPYPDPVSRLTIPAVVDDGFLVKISIFVTLVSGVDGANIKALLKLPVCAYPLLPALFALLVLCI